MPQLPLHPITCHSRPDCLTNNEPDLYRLAFAPQMNHYTRTSRAPATTHSRGKDAPVRHSDLAREHRLRPRASRVPYADGTTRSPGRPGCAFLTGNRVCARGGDYLVETYAYSQRKSSSGHLNGHNPRAIADSYPVIISRSRRPLKAHQRSTTTPTRDHGNARKHAAIVDTFDTPTLRTISIPVKLPLPRLHLSLNQAGAQGFCRQLVPTSSPT